MDSRFFKIQSPIRWVDLLEAFKAHDLIETKAATQLDKGTKFVSLKGLAEARAQDLSFFHNAKYVDQLASTQAGKVLIPADLPTPPLPEDRLIRVQDVHRAMALAGQAFLVAEEVLPGIHRVAVVEAGAQIDPSASIGPFVHIGKDAEIGPGTSIAAGVSVGAGVKIGAHCQIDPQVVISHAVVGDRVHIKPGTCIGQRGFGWALSPKGHVAKPQVGRVLIGNDVEIGANCAIDRGSLEDTRIDDGAVIDNLCHIAHNCHIGRFCAIAATAAFAGSTSLGEFVTMGGSVSATGHLHIAEGTSINAWSLVVRDTKPGQVLMGNPARPVKEHHRLLRSWSRIARGVKG